MQSQFRYRAAAIILLWAQSVFSQPVYLSDAPVAPTFTDLLKSSKKSASIQPSAASDWYDTSNREAVRNAYLDVFDPTTGVPLGYTGNPDAGVAGSTSPAYKAAALTRRQFEKLRGRDDV